MAPQIVQFDYDFSPYAAKTRSLLLATSTPFSRVDVPITAPRPTLQKLGIAFRRIPVLAVGKDAYCDSSFILSTINNTLAVNPLPTSPHDAAYEAFGKQAFSAALTLVKPELLTPEFVKDRKTIFPFVTRPDLGELRPSGLGDWREVFAVIENDFLGSSNSGNGPFINGAKISMADIHVAFVAKWVLNGLGLKDEPGFGEKDLPRTYRWLDAQPKDDAPKIDSEQGIKTVSAAEYSAKDVGVDEGDFLGFKKGEKINIESMDATPGAHPQYGAVVGVTDKQVVIEVEGGVRIHFPRRGYSFKKA